jgi:hypothetical protein
VIEKACLRRRQLRRRLHIDLQSLPGHSQDRPVAQALIVLHRAPQAIPGLSPVPWWGTLFPLAVVLTVNGVKEAFDDYWRHVSDAQVNRR